MSVELDDLGLEQMDFGFDDDFGDNEKPSSNERDPINSLKVSALESLSDVNTYAESAKIIAKNALPEGYSEAVDGVKDVYDVGKDAVNAAVDELKPAKKVIRDTILKRKELASKFLPSKLIESLEREKQMESITGDHEKTQGEIDAGIISAVMADIFKKEQEAGYDEARRSAEADDKMLDLSAVSAQSNIDLVNESNRLLSRLVNYNDKINTGYMQKSLELEFKNHFLARDLYLTTKAYHKDSLPLLESIVRNSSLPDILKGTRSEEYAQLAQDRLFGSINESISDSLSGYMGKFKDNLIEKGRELGRTISDGVGMAGELLNGGMMNGMSEQEKDELIASMAFGQAVESGSEYVGKKLAKVLEKHPSVASAGLELLYLKNNAPFLFEDLVTNGNESEIAQNIAAMKETFNDNTKGLRKGIDSLKSTITSTFNTIKDSTVEKVESVMPDSVKEKLKERRARKEAEAKLEEQETDEFGDIKEEVEEQKGGRLMSFIRSILPSIESNNLVLDGNVFKNSNDKAELTQSMVTSVVDKIPTLLTEIVRQLTIANEGSDENAKVFDSITGRLTNKADRNQNIDTLLDSALRVDSKTQRLDRFTKMLDPSERLSEDQKKELNKALVSMASGFEAGSGMFSYNNLLSSLNNEDTKEAVSGLIKGIGEGDIVRAGKTKNFFDREFSNLRDGFKETQETISLLKMSGAYDDILESGLLKSDDKDPSKVVLNKKAYVDFVTRDKSSTDDLKLNPDIQKAYSPSNSIRGNVSEYENEAFAGKLPSLLTLNKMLGMDVSNIEALPVIDLGSKDASVENATDNYKRASLLSKQESNPDTPIEEHVNEVNQEANALIGILKETGSVTADAIDNLTIEVMDINSKIKAASDYAKAIEKEGVTDLYNSISVNELIVKNLTLSNDKISKVVEDSVSESEGDKTSLFENIVNKLNVKTEEFKTNIQSKVENSELYKSTSDKFSEENISKLKDDIITEVNLYKSLAEEKVTETKKDLEDKLKPHYEELKVKSKRKLNDLKEQAIDKTDTAVTEAYVKLDDDILPYIDEKIREAKDVDIRKLADSVANSFDISDKESWISEFYAKHMEKLSAVNKEYDNADPDDISDEVHDGVDYSSIISEFVDEVKDIKDGIPVHVTNFNNDNNSDDDVLNKILLETIALRSQHSEAEITTHGILANILENVQQAAIAQNDANARAGFMKKAGNFVKDFGEAGGNFFNRYYTGLGNFFRSGGSASRDILGGLGDFFLGRGKASAGKDEEGELTESEVRKSLFGRTIDIALKPFQSALDLQERIFSDAIPSAFRVAKGAVKSFNDKTQDVYVGTEKRPRLLASILKRGGYKSSSTGKPIYSHLDIDSDVVDSSGEVILSMGEIKQHGITGKDGKDLSKGRFQDIFEDAKGLATKTITKGMDLARSSRDFAVNTLRGGKDLAMGLLEGKGLNFDGFKGVKGGFSGKDGDNLLSLIYKHMVLKWPLTEAEMRDAGTPEDDASVKDILKEQMKQAEELASKPSDPADRDGDGKRDGSWQARKGREKKERSKEKAVETKQEREDERDGMFSSILGAVMGVMSTATTAVTGLTSVLGGLMGMKGLSNLADGASAFSPEFDKANKPKGGKLARLARFAGKTALGGASLGFKALRGVASLATSAGGMALRTAGSVVAGIGGVAAAKALAVAAVVYGGYKAGKWIAMGSDLEPLERIRFMQYGFNDSQSGLIRPLRYLEESVIDDIDIEDGKVIYNKPNQQDLIDMIDEEFDFDKGDARQVQMALEWFNGKFLPVCLYHTAALLKINDGIDLDDVDDEIEDDEAVKYLNAINTSMMMDRNIYGVTGTPLPGVEIKATEGAVTSEIEKLLKEFDPAYEETKKSKDKKSKAEPDQENKSDESKKKLTTTKDDEAKYKKLVEKENGMRGRSAAIKDGTDYKLPDISKGVAPDLSMTLRGKKAITGIDGSHIYLDSDGNHVVEPADPDNINHIVSGNVINVGRDDVDGNNVKVETYDGRVITYRKLDKLPIDMFVGDKVTAAEDENSYISKSKATDMADRDMAVRNIEDMAISKTRNTILDRNLSINSIASNSAMSNSEMATDSLYSRLAENSSNIISNGVNASPDKGLLGKALDSVGEVGKGSLVKRLLTQYRDVSTTKDNDGNAVASKLLADANAARNAIINSEVKDNKAIVYRKPLKPAIKPVSEFSPVTAALEDIKLHSNLNFNRSFEQRERMISILEEIRDGVKNPNVVEREIVRETAATPARQKQKPESVTPPISFSRRSQYS